jgi:hypothetical protein
LPVEEKKTGNGSDWITILTPLSFQGFILKQPEAKWPVLSKQPQSRIEAKDGNSNF